MHFPVILREFFNSVDKIMTIENNMKELSSFVYANINKPDHQTTSTGGMNVDKENGAAKHNFDQIYTQT